MEVVWLAIAFGLGFVASGLRLPPLVGFLVAGFVLNGLGAEGGDTIQTIADLGVLLLLFSIGLKLRLRSLLRPEIWAGASIHMLVTSVALGAGILGLGAAGFSVFGGLAAGPALLIGFALSFSSTVFAVKVLEEKGEMGSLHGRVAIGILIMQDIFAVVFLSLTKGEPPSPWTFGLVGLVLLRPLLLAVLKRLGHGELLILFGFVATLLGYELFDVVDLKGDLGALVLGILLSGHRKSEELAKALLGFKDIFLVGFFLSIGLSGTPSFEGLGIAALLTLVVPLKVGLFFLLLTRFHLRARTSLLASLSLANYSEFGLIIGAVGVASGWMSAEWLVIIAISLSLTFVVASPLNAYAHSIYDRRREQLRTWETPRMHPDDKPIDPGDAEILICGMGRLGAGAYDALRERYGDTVIGVDRDDRIVGQHRAAGRNVVLGDPTDSDFWELASPGVIRLVMLAMADHRANMIAVREIRSRQFACLISATAQYEDEVKALRDAGVQAAFDLLGQAGTGYADHVSEHLDRELRVSHGSFKRLWDSVDE
jgi:predicted Kef-type K+ transport protein